MPVRTIEELVHDVLDTMINARPEVGGAEYYSDSLEWVTRRVVGIIFDHPDESVIGRYTQEVLENTGLSRGTPLHASGRTLRLSNPGMVASTMVSPRSQSPVREHDWVRASYGYDNPIADRYVCDSCDEVYIVPFGESPQVTTPCYGTPQAKPRVTIKRIVKKNLPDPEVLRPTRFERDPVI